MVRPSTDVAVETASPQMPYGALGVEETASFDVTAAPPPAAQDTANKRTEASRSVRIRHHGTRHGSEREGGASQTTPLVSVTANRRNADGSTNDGVFGSSP